MGQIHYNVSIANKSLDLQPGNILMKLPTMTRSNMMAIFGEPVLVDAPRNPWARLAAHFPLKATRAIEYQDVSQLPGDIAIGDFGCVRFTSPTHIPLESPVACSPRLSAAPEVIVNCEEVPIGLPSDIWSLGCLIVFLLSGTEFCETRMLDGRFIMADIVKILGSPVPDYVRAWERKHVALQLLDPGTHDALGCRLDELLRANDGLVARMDKEQRSMVSDLLRGIFKWDAKERPNIDEVRSHAWFEEVSPPGDAWTLPLRPAN